MSIFIGHAIDQWIWYRNTIILVIYGFKYETVNDKYNFVNVYNKK